MAGVGGTARRRDLRQLVLREEKVGRGRATARPMVDVNLRIEASIFKAVRILALFLPAAQVQETRVPPAKQFRYVEKLVSGTVPPI